MSNAMSIISKYTDTTHSESNREKACRSISNRLFDDAISDIEFSMSASKDEFEKRVKN